MHRFGEISVAILRPLAEQSCRKTGPKTYNNSAMVNGQRQNEQDAQQLAAHRLLTQPCSPNMHTHGIKIQHQNLPRCPASTALPRLVRVWDWCVCGGGEDGGGGGHHLDTITNEALQLSVIQRVDVNKRVCRGNTSGSARRRWPHTRRWARPL